MNNDIIFLQSKMDKIFNIYQDMNLYPFEIYTIMSITAKENNINYSIKIHNKLINGHIV
jgi:hypothetical protein